jgi:hypothetical protein
MLAASIAPALADTAITNCTELQNMSLTGAYYLANDIDCTCTSDWNSGVGFEPIGNGSNKFTGTFDGQGCKITGLYINRSSTDSVGLFGYLDSGSEIKDVGLDEVNISGYGTYNVGGLVGTNCGKITNCYSSGSVAGPSYVGGLVGENYIEITNCYSTGSVTGSGSNVGGLVSANYFKISNCYSTCSVSGSGSNVGGLVGMNGGGTITNSYYPEDDITCTGKSTK